MCTYTYAYTHTHIHTHTHTHICIGSRIQSDALSGVRGAPPGNLAQGTTC